MSQPAYARIVRLLAALLLLAALGPALFGGLRARPAAAAYAAGDVAAVVTDRLNLRAAPGLDGEVLRILTLGDPMHVTGAAKEADGLTWLPVDAYHLAGPGGPTSGWVASEFVTNVPAPPTSGGDQIEPMVITDALNVRAAPSLSAPVLRVLPRGAIFLSSTDTISAEGYTWYGFELADKPRLGWVAGDFLSIDGGGPGWSFTIGQTVSVATDALNVRSAPSLGAEVLDVLVAGQQVLLTDGPISADGYAWYEIEHGSTAGWVAGEYLVGGESLFAAGDAVIVVDGALNLRAGPGLDAEVLDVLADGTKLTVTDGPIHGNGYLWYRVENDSVDGWVAGTYLQLA